MRHTFTYYALFCALWQLSCGDLLSSKTEQLPAVVVATQEQIDTLQVVANRYVVLFKSLPGLEQAAFVGYHDETVYFSPFLNEKYHYDAGIKDIRLISAVELPSLQEETQTPLTTLNWQQPPPPPTGIIAEVRFASNELAAAHLQYWQEQGDIYFAEPVYVSLVREEPELSPETPIGFDALHAEYNAYQMNEGGDYWWHKEIKLADAMATIAQATNSSSSNYHSWDHLDEDKDKKNSENHTIIAVFDSGIDYEHKALKQRMYDFGDTIPDLACYRNKKRDGKPTKEDGEPNIGEDKYGCNTTDPMKGRLGDGRARPWGTNKEGMENKSVACPSGRDKNGNDVGFAACPHGTHVAGIIAADGKVGEVGCNTAGVCPFCKILNIRVLAGVGEGGPDGSRVGGVTDTSILNGLKYVHELWRRKIEVRIINASIGKFHRSRAVALLIKNLKDMSSPDGGQGVLVIGAAGNEDTMARTYPAALDDVLAVSATGANGEKSKFSNFGMWVDIAAPGGNTNHKICSTIPGNRYRGEAGTSMATPVVAGVAGLMVAVWKKKLSAKEIENRLLFNTDPEKLYPKQKEGGNAPHNNQNETYYLAKLEHVEHPVPLLGFGLLDAEAAVKGGFRPAAKKIIENDPIDRVDLASCGAIGIPVAALPSSLLLLLPLLLMLRYRCRSSCI